MKTVKGYAQIPHQLARAMGLSAHAHRVAVLLLSYTQPGASKPCWPSWRHMCKVTGFGRDRLSSALGELESKRMVRVVRSRQGSRYFIRPVDEWLVKVYEADSKVVLNQDHGSPETGPTLVLKQDSIKNKRLSLTDSDARKDATTQTPSPSSLEVVSPVNQMEAKVHTVLPSDLPISDEAITHVKASGTYRPETDDERKKRECAEVEQYAADPRYIEIFGSSEKVRAHFNKERGIEEGHQDGANENAKDGSGEVKS